MNDLMKSLLNIGITVGLSDRDSFVKSVSGILQEYQQDPERAEKLSKALANYLEQLKQNINNQNSIRSAISEGGFADKENVTELTLAVRELTSELRRFKDRK
jgi:hypothetical protein